MTIKHPIYPELDGDVIEALKAMMFLTSDDYGILRDLYNTLELEGVGDSKMYEKIIETWNIQGCPTRSKARIFVKGFMKYHSYTLGLRIISPDTKRKLRKKGVYVWFDQRLFCYVRREIPCKKLGGR